MDKIKTIAFAEFGAFLQTRALLVLLIFLPLLMGATILVQRLSEGSFDETPQRFAVIDHTGKLYDGLAAQAEARNALLRASGEEGLEGTPFTPERVETAGKDLDEIRLLLSERVRKEDLFAFVEIPAGALTNQEEVLYHSQRSANTDLLKWLRVALNTQRRLLQYQDAGLSPEVIASLESQNLSVKALDLFEKSPDGTIVAAKELDMMATLVAPAVLAILLMLGVMISAPQLLNAVLEEKISRVSEVLLGSVTPFELMTGKLLGSALISFLILGLYLCGGLAVAYYLDMLEYVPFRLLPLLLLFQTMGVLIFGSICLALGSACSELKDAQSMLTPVMFLMVVPMMVLSTTLKNPDGTLSVALSWIPTSTPFVMPLRMMLSPSLPLWQVLLSFVLTLGTTLAVIWAAGRIFRVGLLSQGKSPSWSELLKWVVRG